MEAVWKPTPPLTAEYAVVRWPNGEVFAGPLELCRELPEGRFLRVCSRADALRAAMHAPVKALR
jgi:hypothetical protein